MDALSEETLARLHKLGGAAFVTKMIDLFLGFGAGKVQEAREAFDQREFNRVGRAAHALKSSAANVGALRLTQGAAAIEQQVQAGGEAGLAELVAEMEAAFEEVRPLLVARRDESVSRPGSHE